MNKPIERVGSSALRELRERMQDVFADATTIVDNVRRVAAGSNHVVLLSNTDGIVVTSFADFNGSQELAREGLETGSVWDEERVGTNGIGTCLVSRQPITVFGGAHFFEGFANFTCSAAPIFAPDGRVVGAFDISGRAIPGCGDSQFAQHFAREAATQVSTLLFRKWHRNDCIVALSDEPDPMPMSVKALIATDELGRILGATQEAFAYLGVPGSQRNPRPLGARRVERLVQRSAALEQAFRAHAHRRRLPDVRHRLSSQEESADLDARFRKNARRQRRKKATAPCRPGCPAARPRRRRRPADDADRRPLPAHHRQGYSAVDPRRNRRRQGYACPRHSPGKQARRKILRCGQLRRHSGDAAWPANSSAMRRAPSPAAPRAAAWAKSSPAMAARCSSTRSATCRSSFRRISCASSKNAP